MPTIGDRSGGRVETNVMQGARKLSEQVEAAAKAAQHIHDGRDVLRPFAELSAFDPQSLFSRTVREHRESIETLDAVLTKLCFAGQKIEAIANEAGFGKEAVEVIRAAQIRLRVLRTLACVLSGDRSALAAETVDVRSQVEGAIKKRASGEGWTTEEREAMGKGARPFSSDFEALLGVS